MKTRKSHPERVKRKFFFEAHQFLLQLKKERFDEFQGGMQKLPQGTIWEWGQGLGGGTKEQKCKLQEGMGRRVQSLLPLKKRRTFLAKVKDQVLCQEEAFKKKKKRFGVFVGKMNRNTEGPAEQI